MKNRLNKLLAMLLVCTMLLSLCACTESQIPAADSASETSGSTTVQTDYTEETTAPTEETTGPATEPATEPVSVQTQPIQEETIPDIKPTEPEDQPKASLHNFHNSSFFNDTNSVMTPGEVTILPRYVYYDGNELIAECFVINGTSNTVHNISVNELGFSNDFGLNCSGSFGTMDGAVIAPGCYIIWTFQFPADCISSYGRLEFLNYRSNITYNH